MRKKIGEKCDSEGATETERTEEEEERTADGKSLITSRIMLVTEC